MGSYHDSELDGLNGIVERIEDARMLYSNGRRMGALLSVLVALAATARKRYPREDYKDREAFTRFLKDDMHKAGLGLTGNFNIGWGDRSFTFEELLYELVRCDLVHEATVDHDIEFIPGPGLSISVGEGVVLSDGWIDALAKLVVEAPENQGIFDH